MSKKSETDYYYQKGVDDKKRGVYDPPNESLTDSLRVFDDASIEEVQSAYDAGHSSDGGSDD